jgi:hypothetical protein
MSTVRKDQSQFTSDGAMTVKDFTRYWTILVAIGILIAASLMGWFQAESARNARNSAAQSLARCQILAGEIRSARLTERASLEQPIEQDQLFRKLSGALVESGIQPNQLTETNTRPSQRIGKGAIMRHSVELTLEEVTQPQLLAFLRGAYAAELPLAASKIRFDATENSVSKGDDEVWDIKLLLTYFVRSATSVN